MRAGVAGGLAAARQIHPHAPMAITPAATAAVPAARLWSLAVVLVFIAYACDAFGFVPHTVFWVDYLDRELQLGAGYAFTQWAFFGLGAIAGPLCVAYCATRWGGGARPPGPMHSRPWP
ncbi:YbfB/YjiJ family MFS transporter [Staphylococcus epidermidis]|nr:YbfB/YjiJ family MFS transporter [Staphylococcus epidermidis]